MPRDPRRSKRVSLAAISADQTDFDAKAKIAPRAVTRHHGQAQLGGKREAGAISKRYVAAPGLGGEESSAHRARSIELFDQQPERRHDLFDVPWRCAPLRQPTDDLAIVHSGYSRPARGVTAAVAAWLVFDGGKDSRRIDDGITHCCRDR